VIIEGSRGAARRLSRVVSVPGLVRLVVAATACSIGVALSLPGSAAADLHFKGTVTASASGSNSGEGYSYTVSNSATWHVDSMEPEGGTYSASGHTRYFLLDYTGSWQEHGHVTNTCAPSPGNATSDQVGSGSGTVDSDNGDAYTQLELDTDPIANSSWDWFVGVPWGSVTYTDTNCNGDTNQVTYDRATNPYILGFWPTGATSNGPLPRSGKVISGTVQLSGPPIGLNSGSGSLTFDLTVTCPDGTAPNKDFVCPQQNDKCSDGVDNDGDGYIDFPDDPGCSGVHDSSELGTNQCDNGKDDDGDGKVDWPADTDCPSIRGTTEHATCRSANRGSEKDIFDARVASFGPDAHLFKFQTFATFCYTGLDSPTLLTQVLSVGAPFGSIDYGVDTYALELLGFGLDYDPTGEEAIKSGNTATFSGGEFVMTFDWLSLVGRFGLDGLVKDVVKGGLESAVKKIVHHRHFRRSKLEQVLISAAQRVTNKALNKYDDLVRRALGRLPGFLQPLIQDETDRLRGKIKGRLKDFEGDIKTFSTRPDLARSSATAIINRWIDHAIDALGRANPLPDRFPMWDPVIKFTVLPDGTTSVYDDGWHNPFLTISETKDRK
jgi:hypothetical protein